MAAWRHYAQWKNSSHYANYRRYVGQRAPQMEKNTMMDCADLSMTLLMEYASANGLCVTFTDDRGAQFISKGNIPIPSGARTEVRNAHQDLHWDNDKEKYMRAVRKYQGARSLFQRNLVLNKQGPQVGDVMARADHAAIVYAVYPPKTLHPLGDRYVDKADPKNPASIPRFPGEMIAQTQLDQTRYFRDEPPVKLPVVLPTTPAIHVDYLNHRGFGKEEAELILYANVDEMKKQGLDFYSYSPSVLNDWTNWDGTGFLPI